MDSVLLYADSGENYDLRNFHSFIPSYQHDPNALLPREQDDLPVVNRANDTLVEAADDAMLSLLREKTASLLRNFDKVPRNSSTDRKVSKLSRLAFDRRSGKETGLFVAIHEDAQPEQSQLFNKKSSWKNEPFTPSPQLLDFIRVGMAEHAKYLNSETNVKVSDVQTNSFGDAVVFNNVLSDILSRIAFRTLDKIYTQSQITTNQKFELVFQHALLDYLPIIPLELEKFQSRLRRELIDYLEGEGKLEGRWGGVTVRNGELEFALEQSPLRGTELNVDWDFAVSDD